MATDIYYSRKNAYRFLVVFAALIFITRLLWLQVIDDTYAQKADRTVIRNITVYPSRGLIYDRNEKLIVYNNAVYDLMVIPAQVQEMDTNKFCELLNIEKSFFIDRLKKIRENSEYKPDVLIKQIPAEVYAQFQEFLFEFPGFFEQVRTIRSYPYKSAAHILGDIAEVDSSDIKKSNFFYHGGDYMGNSGLEKMYEHALMGKRGSRAVVVDVHNREISSYKNGIYDTVAVAGNDLTTSIDIDLQMYAEQLMQNKRGSIVAIDPSTGEILCIVSSPSYDPNLLTGKYRGNHYLELLNDTANHPLINRAITGFYPPGSTFKTLMALMGLQAGSLHPNSTFSCSMGYHVGSFSMGCHSHPQAMNVIAAVQNSCNSYFAHVFRDFVDQSKFDDAGDGIQAWHDYASQFGLGKPLGVDLPGEDPGLLPDEAYYDKKYPNWRWGSLTVVSLSIGQGELATTPIQIANMMAAIANRGYYIIPHLAKSFATDTVSSMEKYSEKHLIETNKEYFDLVVDGMEKVVSAGTARLAAIPGMAVCGKTGTAENAGISHSIFAGFAPKDNPKIAIAAYIENATWGGTYAAPIASLVIEKYMNDSISTPRLAMEKRLMETNLLDFHAP